MLKDLSVLSFEDIAFVGGKAAGLGELIKEGIRVPIGIAVSCDEYEKRMSEPDIQSIVTQFGDGKSLRRAHRQRMDQELNQPIGGILRATPPLELAKVILGRLMEQSPGFQGVIVRSSATAEDSKTLSFAGQFLTTRSPNIPEKLADAIARVWASASASHVRAYIHKRTGSESPPVKMAIIVQEYIDFNIGGLLFSKHPTVRLDGWALIEFANGTTEDLVMGRVVPNRCRISLMTGKVVWEKHKPDNGILNVQDLRILSEWAVKMQRRYGCEVDMEWGKNVLGLFALQCRPATHSADPAISQ